MSILDVVKEITHELLDAKAESYGLRWKCNQLEFERDKLKAENAKLRELVSDTLMDTNDYAHKYGLPEHDWKAVNNHLNDRMQELGVEVGND